MDDFRKVVDYCGFQDLGYIGPNFTWCNMQERENRKYLRLDRAFATPEWIGKFGGKKVHHIADSTSDHSALVILDSTSKCHTQAKQFHFEVIWTKNVDCKAIIEASWGMGDDLSTPEGIVENLKLYVAELIKWSSKVYGKIPKKKTRPKGTP